MLSIIVTIGSSGLLNSAGLHTRFAQPAAVARPHIRSIAESPNVQQDVVAAPPPKQQKDRLNIRIDDEWYDLTTWRKAHPAGEHWIDAYKNADATEVMYGFHSDKAMGMIKRLPKSKSAPTDVPPPVESSYAFRELRRKLEADGWYRPHWRGELQKLLPWAGFVAASTFLAKRAGPLASFGAILCFAISNSLAGWLSHDFVHGRNPWSMAMRGFGELVGGMSTTWWSMKHNMHHALTNEIGYDEDVALEPFLYLWQPDPKSDSPARKYQHLTWPIPFSILFLYWRFDSIRYVFKWKKWNEAARLAAHYAMVLAILPAKVVGLGIWLSGLITATIVTVTHQSEEIFISTSGTSRKYDFCEAQFRSTRDAMCSNWFSDILWGGMQWQLEHHLFPTMPRYKYKALHPLLREWAKEHNLEFRTSGEWEVVKQNIDQLHKLSALPAVEGNPDSTPIFKQV